MKHTKAEQKRVQRTAPQWAWDTIDETLAMDAHSSAFDRQLRREIQRALAAMRDGEEFARHRKADPHCTCNDCVAYHEAHSTTGPPASTEVTWDEVVGR